jgi:hypothetical protein
VRALAQWRHKRLVWVFRSWFLVCHNLRCERRSLSHWCNRLVARALEGWKCHTAESLDIKARAAHVAVRWRQRRQGFAVRSWKSFVEARMTSRRQYTAAAATWRSTKLRGGLAALHSHTISRQVMVAGMREAATFCAEKTVAKVWTRWVRRIQAAQHRRTVLRHAVAHCDGALKRWTFTSWKDEVGWRRVQSIHIARAGRCMARQNLKTGFSQWSAWVKLCHVVEAMGAKSHASRKRVLLQR